MAELSRSQRLKINTAVTDLTDAIIEYHNDNSGTLPKADDADHWGDTTLDDLNGEISTAIHVHETTGHGAHSILTADQLDGVSIDDLNNGFLKAVNFHSLPVNYCNFVRNLKNPPTSGKDLDTYKGEEESSLSTGLIIAGVLTVAIGGKQAVFDNVHILWPDDLKDYSDQGYIAAERDDNDQITLRLLSDRINTITPNPETNTRLYVGTWDKNYLNQLWNPSNAKVHGFVSNNMFSRCYLKLQQPGIRTNIPTTARAASPRLPWQRAHL